MIIRIARANAIGALDGRSMAQYLGEGGQRHAVRARRRCARRWTMIALATRRTAAAFANAAKFRAEGTLLRFDFKREPIYTLILRQVNARSESD